MNNDTIIGRRRVLGLLAASAGAVAFAACGSDNNDDAAVATTTSTTATGAAAGGVGEIPTETGGPYPGDATNGPDYLSRPGAVRSDIRASLGGSPVDGVPLDIVLTMTDASTGATLPGVAVYLWHCDRQGRYSMYGDVAEDTFLRGVQVADADGVIHFTSIFPAAYDGRWPHIHFEIFDDLAKATNGRNARTVTQLALPQSVCQTVYNESGYQSSQANLARESLSSDMVFRDGVDKQLATLVGSVAGGYTASLTVGIQSHSLG